MTQLTLPATFCKLGLSVSPHPRQPGSQHTVAPCAETLAGEDGFLLKADHCRTYYVLEKPAARAVDVVVEVERVLDL